jgi:glycosyltransferase involved in cell wall biosynthesis
MSFLDRITVLILTHNEEANIARTLQSVVWARRIVVIDSGSTDATAAIVGEFRQAEFVVRPFDAHYAQWNFGLEVCGDTSEWVLALDADYQVDQVARDEIAALSPAQDICGYRASFRYCVFGRALRSNLYPPVVVLFRRERASYVQHGHTQRLVTEGCVRDLNSPLNHDDRKPLARWFSSQQRYARLEAEYLLSTSLSNLRRNDRIRLWGWAAPPLVFFYVLIVKRCVFDGWRGWFYVLQRTLAETMIALEIMEGRFHANLTNDKSESARKKSSL